jgi:hypothetical protein
MQMPRVPRDLVKKTIYFVDALPGEVKTEYIENILDDYEF